MTTDVFVEHRSALTGVAYRVLGSASEAEDVVQEAWLRWSRVDHATVEDPRAYLVTVVSRIAVDRLRSARVRRESYVGEWLPEPVSTAPDGSERAEIADSVEFALLVVLETLSPLERAVFVLREAFQFPYADIAEVIGREEAATRQLARRAREHVQERRPRFEADRATRRRITERFLAACLEGDLEGITGLLAEDATLVGDGGGRARAPLRSLHGTAKVGRFLASITSEPNTRRFLAPLGLDSLDGLWTGIVELNGGPAAVVAAGDRVLTVMILEVVGDRVRDVYLIVNPEKMSRVRPPLSS
ncbi:RNA polymerase sigma factor SigJ [Nocardiopsis sp. NRRL B-16309]|uniref:RNA polymerase sigma factor SigJ n=1 Tax=Nocardiopsis sp. NRRL B-16309 TaxID=1519494 RepID=UPI0006AE155A|nr:RNA polymerase sigma factor SigJ [Nocardiopsis sp. NRRL B-16309]KOX13137.1 RNA polymerase sigma24 factor [Nocardiopsis sp. NRRL B-16309]